MSRYEPTLLAIITNAPDAFTFAVSICSLITPSKGRRIASNLQAHIHKNVTVWRKGPHTVCTSDMVCDFAVDLILSLSRDKQMGRGGIGPIVKKLAFEVQSDSETGLQRHH